MLNVPGGILLAALLLVRGLEVVVAVLTLRRKETMPPPFFQDSISPEAYGQSLAYVHAQARMGLVHQGVHLAGLLGFWFLGGFAGLDGLVRALGLGGMATGLVYLAVLALLSWLLGLPFDIYRIFVLDEKFGLNRTTLATFLADLAKGSALAVVLGGGLVSAVLAFFLWAGAWAWLACWLASVGLMVLLQYVAPRWIIPLFLRFTPLPEGALRQAILDYATRMAFPVGEILVVDGSRRSTKANAFVSGFGRNRRIALFDTLVERMTVEEMVAVVAHEVGHDRHHHQVKGLLAVVVQLGVLFWLLSLFMTEVAFFQAFFVETVSVPVGLALFGIFFEPLDRLLSLLWKGLSRHYERQADRFAAASTGNPRALATALKKLAAANLSELTPHPLHVWLHASHPPVVERVALLLEYR